MQQQNSDSISSSPLSARQAEQAAAPIGRSSVDRQLVAVAIGRSARHRLDAGWQVCGEVVEFD